MACLNLPENIRYKPENLYVAGLVPGPKEPPLDELNHFMRPVLADLRDSWLRGVKYTKTALSPFGRNTRSAIVVGVFDLPGGRKAAGMAGHHSHWFCAICDCYHLETRGRTDCENWTRRDVTSLRAAAHRWRSANTFAERQAIFKNTGVRWSELWELPYWDPTRQLSSEPMHILFEGLAEDHSRGVLVVSAAEASRPLSEPSAFTWDFRAVPSDSEFTTKEKQQVVKIHTLLTAPLVELDDTDHNSTIHDINWLSSRLATINLPVLRFVCEDLQVLPSHTGRIVKAEFVQALCGWRQQQPYRPDEEPAMRLVDQDVMARIKDVIDRTATPSWLGTVPNTYGSPAAGSLKADQWRTLFTVYLPIALISLWGAGSVHKSSRVSSQLRDTLDHTMALVSAILIASSRHTSASRAARYREHMRTYVAKLHELYPHLSPVTNQHVAFHIYDSLLLFGPAHSWWAFPYERLIGHLQRLPSNHKPGAMESTVLRSFIQASKLRQWLSRADCPPALHALQILFDKAFSMEPPDYNDSPTTMNAVRVPEDLQRLTGCSRLPLQARVKHGRVVYARSSTHLGNSLIQYYPGGDLSCRAAGSIKYIYVRVGKLYLAVQRHLPAPPGIPDAFRVYPELNAFTCSAHLRADIEEVDLSWVLGHSARYHLSPELCVMLLLSRVSGSPPHIARPLNIICRTNPQIQAISIGKVISDSLTK
ncbi:hypothetical protein BDW22DRAFT_1458214 [Trametopsis cervina]|nr:hypothetical protein BDW22DRAFT_1458214 [Trametopsis cervina]